MKVCKLLMTIFFVLIVRYIAYSQEGNTVINQTNYNTQDLITNVLSVLNVSDVIVYVRAGSNSFLKDSYVCEIEDNKTYIIFIEISADNIHDKIIHECVHIQQFYSDRLTQVNKTTVRWKGKNYQYNDSYDNKEYEREAQLLGPHIRRLLDNLPVTKVY